MKEGKIRLDALIAAATAMELPIGAEAAEGLPGVYATDCAGLKIGLLVTGPGPTNAAIAAGAALARYSPALILAVGIGGAYPSSGLAACDLAVAMVEFDADTGVESHNAGPPAPLSIPVNRGVHGRYDADPETSALLFSAASSCALALFGPFVTSATVTASASRAERLGSIYGAICENMEGAPLARAAELSGTLFAEVRGISNIAGPRDPSNWRIREAAEASKRAALAFLEILAGRKPR